MSRSHLLFLTILVFSCSNRISKSNTPLINQKTIEFSGYTWLVTESGKLSAPGPNFWNAQNVWVDDKGLLHLKITKDNNGLWHCAELRTLEKFGLGEYEFWVEGQLDTLDKNIVLGMFNYSGRDHKDEIDIEISRWGNFQQNNLYYTVYPKKGRINWKASGLLQLNGSYSTHRFIRSRSQVVFQSLHGFQEDEKHGIFSGTCDNYHIISTESMPVFINFWLFKGQAPVKGNEAEIIIHRFKFSEK